MSEENKNMTPQEPEPEAEKLPKAKRTALVRYIAILFVFAFLIVLLSLFLQYRSTASKQISDLTSASNSAIARAEQLQNENVELEQAVTSLQTAADAAQKEHEQALAAQQKVYDALVRLFADPEKITNPDDADVKTVTEGKDQLSQAAWEAYVAFKEETENKVTEDTDHD